jgi:mRNA-degrading endonuclease RelE of RelBE toxin-antitoxin system
LTIRFAKKAEKHLLTLPKRTALNLLEKINRIPAGDIGLTPGRKGEYRFRFGKFRVLFYIEFDEARVFKIGTRGDVYK